MYVFPQEDCSIEECHCNESHASRAENNRRSTDNVQPDRWLDRSNSHLAGHFDRPFMDTNIFFFAALHKKLLRKRTRQYINFMS